MDEKYMDIAIDEAKKAFKNDEVPVGAVIVYNGKILAKTHNEKEQRMCSVAHAEILAIEQATKKIKNWRLCDCDLYVTLEPCPMCASAIKQSRIRNVYSGLASEDKQNSEIVERIFGVDSLNPSVNHFNNLKSIEIDAMMKSFFEKQRKRNVNK